MLSKPGSIDLQAQTTPPYSFLDFSHTFCRSAVIELSVVRDLVAIVGVVVAFSYYVLTLRNADRTRQTQIMLQIFNASTDPSRLAVMQRVLQEYEWTDYEDYKKKYAFDVNPEAHVDIQGIRNFMSHLGVLLASGRIDSELLGMSMTGVTQLLWYKLEPVILAERLESGMPYRSCYFEFLKDEMEKREHYPRGKAAYLREKIKA